MRQRPSRLVGTLLVVALLVVPAVASAHTHRDLDAGRSCATCVAAHHSPAIVIPTVGAGAAATPVVAPPASPSFVPACPHRSPRAGRAPPAPVLVSAT